MVMYDKLVVLPTPRIQKELGKTRRKEGGFQQLRRFSTPNVSDGADGGGEI